MITESGIVYSSDNIRSDFIIAHLRVLERLIREGFEVKGYLH